MEMLVSDAVRDGARLRIEWRGGLYEDCATFDEARQKVLAIFPHALTLPWATTPDGNYRALSFVESFPEKSEPVARLLIALVG